MFKNISFSRFMFGLVVVLGCSSGKVLAQDQAVGERPALVVTNTQPPKSILDRAYTSPKKARDITAEEIIGNAYYKPSDTMVSRKISDLDKELAILQDKVVILSDALAAVQRSNQDKAAQYYAALATIYTQLQTGTTPGNPRMLEKLSSAENTLDDLVESRSKLNHLSIDSSKVATEASFLLDSARAAYGLSGAVEEDHIVLAGLEDRVNSTIVMIERLLNTITDDIDRADVYASEERDNLRNLSLAVSNGNLNGRSFADRPFSGTRDFSKLSASAEQSQMASAQVVAPTAQTTYRPDVQRPLVKIAFDRNDVGYEQPLVQAIAAAQKKYPDVNFNIVGLHPAQGNAAEIAIESTRARRNTQRVLRTMSQAGIDSDHIQVSYDQSDEVDVNSVHVYIF